MTGTVINLRTAKKQAARTTARKVADAKAARFGQSKAARQLDKAVADKAARDLEAHRREQD